MNINPLFKTDSYKYSHYDQYKAGATKNFAYGESRGGVYDETVFVGLQILLKDFLTKPFTQEDIDEAQELVDAHIGPGVFNREGFEYILKEYGGYFPVKIRAVPEGSVIPFRNVLYTIENTGDERTVWVPSFLETVMLRAVWYPTTVASNSRSIKKVIKQYLDETASSNAGLMFSLHDFGARGVSSSESAAIGGLAHLVNFMGTDTVEALWAARKFYDADMPAFSVAAMEHSTVTIYGRDGEAEAYRNMLKRFGGKDRIIACVSDSYDIYNAVENIWGGELKEEVIANGEVGGKVVIRPDSGDPATVVLKVVTLLDKAFGSTMNDKGFKELPPYIGVIQGDGINEQSIREILGTLKAAGYAASNVIFGMGGALLQQVNRDTNKFANKTSAAIVNGEDVDVFKDPITDTGKRSKKGFITLYRNKETGDYVSGRIENAPNPDYEDALVDVFENGKLLKEYTFEEVRANAAL